MVYFLTLYMRHPVSLYTYILTFDTIYSSMSLTELMIANKSCQDDLLGNVFVSTLVFFRAIWDYVQFSWSKVQTNFSFLARLKNNLCLCFSEFLFESNSLWIIQNQLSAYFKKNCSTIYQLLVLYEHNLISSVCLSFSD